MITEKTKFIWFNNKLIPWNEAKIHVTTHALHYGSSIFEGIRCYNSNQGPVLFRCLEHINRLYDSAKIYRIKISYTLNQLIEACKIIVRKNNLVQAYIRPLIFVGDTSIGLRLKLNYNANVVIIAVSWKDYLGEKALHEGIDVMISSWNRLSANTIPTMAKAGGNYLSSILISNEANINGYHEGIALDTNGYVSECAGENIFTIKKNILFTPKISSSILPGITRDTIITLAKDIGLKVYEEILPRESLYLADEVFISGTAAEIIPVRSIDKIKIGAGNCGLITKKIQERFFKLFTGETIDKWQWLDLID